MGAALELMIVPFAIFITAIAFTVLDDPTVSGVVTWAAVLSLMVFALVQYLRFAKSEEPPGER